MGTAIKHPVPDRVKPSFVIFDFRALWRCPERQSARMSKITNDGLTRSGKFHVRPVFTEANQRPTVSKQMNKLWILRLIYYTAC